MTFDPASLDPHWWWLVVALILGIAEIILPGFFLMWFAAAAALVGIIAYLVPISVPLQAALFAIVAIAAVYAGRRFFRRNPVETTDPHLNDRTARLIGEVVMVVEPIAGGTGRVRVGDGVWNARGPDTPSGVRVRVTGAQGTTLLVEPE